MNNLQMNIAMAKLEGVEIVLDEGDDIAISKELVINMLRDARDSKDSFYGFDNTEQQTTKALEYNPITDLALNCMLRDKYEVEIEHYFGSASMQSAYTDRPNEFVCRFDSKQEIPHAVITCILKSKGLWV